MSIQTFQNTTLRSATLGNMPTATGDQFVLGLVTAKPPAESSLSLGRTFLPPLPIPDAKSGRADDGDPTMRYPLSPAPAGPVGSVPGSPVRREVLEGRLTTAAARTPAATATLESKLDPFGRRRDCQSPPARADFHADSKTNASWPTVTVSATTTASPE